MDELIKKIREMKFQQGYTNLEISKKLGITRDKVKHYTCKRYDEVLRKKEIRQKAENEFVELVKKYLPISNSLNHLCNNLGLRGVDGYYQKLKRIIRENGLSTEHFGTIKLSNNGGGRNIYTAMSDDEFFIKNSNRHGSSIIKRLIKNGYKEYKCENCGINEWDGKPLRLQVHHINGEHNDNRIENLQLLCPNCHTQTDTYAKNNISKKKGFKITNRINEILNGAESSFKPIEVEKIKERILPPKEKKYCKVCGKEIIGGNKKYCSHSCADKASKKFDVDGNQLKEDFQKLKSYCAVGRKYGVSDNAIKKRCKKLNIFDEIEHYITHRGKYNKNR
jgi:predicted transcriptional regulator